jgi:hypothetical protein
VFGKCGYGGAAVGADGHFVPHPRDFQAHQLLQSRFVVGEEELEPVRLLRVGFGFVFHAASGPYNQR